MATMKVMRRIFDVLRRDRRLATANIVRSCPDDWKQGDGLHSPAIVADNYQGKPFGRPNDIVADRNGGVYFTDIPPDRTVGTTDPG